MFTKIVGFLTAKAKFGKSNARRRAARSFKPCLEQLEDRTLLSTVQLLANPSFSSGASNWNRTGDFYTGTNLANYRTVPGYAAGGVTSAGQAKNNASGSIYQQFTIPSNATSVTASWYRYVTTNETTTSTPYDYLYVRLLNSSGSVLSTLKTYSNLNKETGYVQDSVNLSGYLGQTVRLQFFATSDSSHTTTFRLDDISAIANIPDAPTPPSAPSNLTATAVSSSQINLSWSDNSGNETGFKIERKMGSTGTWTQVANVGANVKSYSNTGLSAGTAYYYRVRAYNSSGNSGYSNEAYQTTLQNGPSNNNFVNRASISGTTSTVTGANVGATKETSEPNHAGNSGGKSVWWTWTAPSSGSVQIDTIGSNFDTLLGVYTGSSVSSLTHITSDDQSGGSNTSKVTFNAVAGTVYQIAVDGYYGASGSITLHVTKSGDQYELDNTPGQAQSIVSGTTQTHSIHVVGDVDWVKFTLTAPSEVSIITNTSSSALKALTLFGPDNYSTQRAYSDDTYYGGARLYFTGSQALAAGTYYVRINELGNDATISSYNVQVNIVPAVRLTLRSGAYGPIDPTTMTWLVVHGRTSSPNAPNISALSQALDGFSASDQVLMLDWSILAADNGSVMFGAEDWIKPVAAWAADQLTSYGFVGTNRNNLNLIGHSWGSYVSAEISERLGNVNTIVALDPAANGSGSFDPDVPGEIDFKRNSNRAWAFFESGNDPYGSWSTPLTADESYVVLHSSHSNIVNVFANMLNANNLTSSLTPNTAVSHYFRLNRLLQGVDGPWTINAFSNNGGFSPSYTGWYEAVIDTDMGGTYASRLEFSPLKTFNVQASDGLTNKIQVSWNPVTAALSYDVLRNTSNHLGSASRIAHQVPGLSWDDTSAAPGIMYFYWVTALHGETPGLYSDPDVGSRNAVSASQLVANGGFETGNLSGWTVTAGGQFPKIVATGAATGTYALQLGDGGSGLGSGNLASIQQTVAIPSSSSAPRLSLRYKVQGTDGENWDWMRVYVNGTQIASWFSDTNGWQTFTFDLTAYRGQSVTVNISSWTRDTVAPVNYFVDDVSILA
jgi:pimeloyl-ACP methyl ester carboxylesterase